MNDRNKRFVQLRKALGMSQEEIGNVIGIKRSGVSNIEGGTRDVTEKHIKLLCIGPIQGKYVNEEWLRSGDGGNENMFKKQFVEDEYMAYATEIGLGSNDRIKQAIIKYGRLSPENKKIIDDALDLLSELLKGE